MGKAEQNGDVGAGGEEAEDESGEEESDENCGNDGAGRLALKDCANG